MARKIYYRLPSSAQTKTCDCGATIAFVQVPKRGGRPGQMSWMPLSVRTAVLDLEQQQVAEPHFGDCRIWIERRAREAEQRKAAKAAGG